MVLSQVGSQGVAYPQIASGQQSKPGALYEDGKYENQKKWSEPSFVKSLPIMWDFLFNGKQRTPEKDLPHQRVDLEFFNSTSRNQLSATWLGHSSLLINMDGFRVLTDPVFEKRVSVFGPTRFGDLPMDIGELRDIDVVIVSHNHYDHLNKFSIRFLKDKVKTFVVPRGVGALIHKWGVSKECIVELNWWEEYRLGEKLMIAATPAQHFSGRGLTDRNKTLWASWVIASQNHKIFFSGDSGYFDGFKQIGNTYGPFDMTFIECGAYDKKWHFVHMFPKETLQAHVDLKGDVLHPIHWATFNLGMHPWYEPMERLTAATRATTIKMVTPLPGETTVYNAGRNVTKWWKPLIAEYLN